VDFDGTAALDVADSGERRHLAEIAREIAVAGPGRVLHVGAAVHPRQAESPALLFDSGISQRGEGNAHLDRPAIGKNLARRVEGPVPFAEARAFDFDPV